MIQANKRKRIISPDRVQSISDVNTMKQNLRGKYPLSWRKLTFYTEKMMTDLIDENDPDDILIYTVTELNPKPRELRKNKIDEFGRFKIAFHEEKYTTEHITTY